MSNRNLTIAVAGATGSVGREIVRLLNKVPVPIQDLIPVASPGCASHTIEFRERSVVVRNLDLPTLEGCDVVFLATPPPVAAAILPELIDHGIAVIDLSGVLAAAGAPLVAARVNGSELAAFSERRAVACPHPLAVALSTLMSPLCRELGELRCRGLALHPASSRGQAGIEEFTRQVVALFSQQVAPVEHFPTGLAFDVVPRIGEAGPDGWSRFELDVAQQTSHILGVHPSDVAVSSVVAPWYTSLCLSLHLQAERALSLEWVETRLQRARGTRMAGESLEQLPHPRTVTDALLHVGRLRMDPSGEGVHLWAVADEIRFGAAGNAVHILQTLVEDGLL